MSGYNHFYINRLVESYQSTNKGVTIKDLADLIGLSKAALDKVRKGEVEPKAGTLFLIALFFGVTVNDFYNGLIQNPDDKLILRDAIPEYKRKESKDDPWRIAYEQQKEISDLREQLAHSVNENAPVQGANAG